MNPGLAITFIVVEKQQNRYQDGKNEVHPSEGKEVPSHNMRFHSA